MRPNLTLVTAATLLPVTLGEAKDFFRIPERDNTEDARVMASVRAALYHLEGRRGKLNRALLTQTWDATWDRFPTSGGEVLKVPLAPLQSVTWVRYVDEDGDTQTWSSAEYQVDTASEPGRIKPLPAYSWPNEREQMAAVTVRFVAGYGDTRGAVPETLKELLLTLGLHYFEQRQPTIEGTIITAVPMHLQDLIDNHTVYDFGG